MNNLRSIKQHKQDRPEHNDIYCTEYSAQMQSRFRLTVARPTLSRYRKLTELGR